MAIVVGHESEALVLITRRPAHVHLGGSWELPGGKVRPGETPAEAAAREVREEIGLEVGTVEFVAVDGYAYPDRLVRLHLFVAMPADRPSLAAGLEHRWVALEDLPGAELPPANAGLTAALIEWHRARNS